MAKTNRDFYAILGVPKDANEEQLKKAYKKLAMKWHPDKNLKNKEEAEAKFKDVGQAFAVLSDPKLRKVYDQYGEEGLNAGMTGDENIPQGGFGGPNTGFTYTNIDPNEIFEQFFGAGLGKGGNFFFTTSGPGKSMKFGQPGRGMKSSRMPGGFSSMFSEFEPMDVESEATNPQDSPQMKRKREKQSPCVKDLFVTLEDIYHGTTKKLKVSKRVALPTGGYGQATKVLEIPIKPGMKAGTKFTFHQEGDESHTHETQDLVFVLKEKPHEVFVREGDDLVQTVTISLQQALEGTNLTVPTIDGKTLRVAVDPMSMSTERKTLPGQGLPNSKTQQRGNMHINFRIKFPSKEGTVRKKVLAALESTA